MPPPTAALGLRAHSGWAALVAITGPLDSPSIIDRRTIQLCNPKTRGSKQPYHAAEPLPYQQAERFVTQCIDETRHLADEGLRAAIQDVQNSGHHIAACGILLGSGRTLPTLERILASHALIHAAEGEMFRDALLHAAQECKLTVKGIKERELHSQAAAMLGRSAEQLRDYLTNQGRILGAPWREDQKCATLAAWLALSA
jgi:hypothetical protein